MRNWFEPNANLKKNNELNNPLKDPDEFFRVPGRANFTEPASPPCKVSDVSRGGPILEIPTEQKTTHNELLKKIS